jgi:acetyltransferase
MDVKKFYFPRSIVVFGVSDSPGNLGREIIKNLDRFGFSGAVYGFGRKAMEVEGRQVFADLDDMPETPDLAALLVPASTIAEAVEACGKKGVRHVVIETGGFSEFGAERRALEDAIRDIARAWGITCLGPNCIGTINMENSLCLPFVPFDPDEIGQGKNSFISQSGGVIHEVVRRYAAENVGLSKITSIGNKLMVDENDILEFLIEDPGTEAIGLYLEDIENGRRLMDLASGTTKPVIVLKGNASPAGREIASFHTAALVGDEQVTEAALRQAGIHQVASPQEMVESFKIFDLPAMKGTKVAIISRSGGQSVLLADEAYRHGFGLARLSSGVFDLIRERSKGDVIRRTNPVDLGDVFDEIFYLEVLGEVLKDSSVDGVVFFFDYEINRSAVPDMVKGASRLSRLNQKPVVLCMVPDRAHWFRMRDISTFPFFSHPQWAFDGLRRSLAHFRRKAGKGTGIARIDAPEREAAGPGQEPSFRLASAAEALAFIKGYGVPVPDYALVADKAEAKQAARRIGYPVVLKGVEPPILHKTEAGAVRLGIADDRELEEAVEAMNADLYLVQKMAPPGVETIIGGKRDPEFGPVVVFGLGGIFVEVLRDVTLRVAPIDAKTAREMMGEIRGFELLEGVRGTEAADVESLAEVIAGVSKLLADHPEITSLDINPLRVFGKGTGCLALDVKIGLLR